MNRQEWKAWAQTLNPGDKVILDRWGELTVAVVEKVTNCGWIRTNKGVFSQRSYGEWFYERGGYATIVPTTPEALKEAEEWDEIKRIKKKNEETIRKAKGIMYDLARSEIKANFAEAFLKFYEERKGK